MWGLQEMRVAELEITIQELQSQNIISEETALMLLQDIEFLQKIVFNVNSQMEKDKQALD